MTADTLIVQGQRVKGQGHNVI